MLVSAPLLKPILRPLTRLFVGFIAIPLFRLLLRRVVNLEKLDHELEKDLEQWFRGSLLLLIASRNMEESLFGWVHDNVHGDYRWFTMGLRLMLAVSVVEAMPDQELFAIIHPGPPKLKFDRRRSWWAQVRENFWPTLRGMLCQHINRSSPVFAILAAIAPGRVGWICYFLAIFQYLVIGLVTSRDKAIDVLSVFDQQMAEKREELIREFDLDDDQPAPTDKDPPPAGSSTSETPQASPVAKEMERG